MTFFQDNVMNKVRFVKGYIQSKEIREKIRKLFLKENGHQQEGEDRKVENGRLL